MVPAVPIILSTEKKLRIKRGGVRREAACYHYSTVTYHPGCPAKVQSFAIPCVMMFINKFNKKKKTRLGWASGLGGKRNCHQKYMLRLAREKNRAQNRIHTK